MSEDTPMRKLTLTQAAERYLQTVEDSAAAATKRAHTRRSFAYALQKFLEVVQRRAGLNPATTRVTRIDPEWVAWFITWLKRQQIAPTTERLRLTAVRGFYNFLSAEGLPANPARVAALITQRATPVSTKEQFLDPADVEQLLAWAQARVVAPHRSPAEKLRALRDYAFLLLLADTGLRVSEACDLSLSDLPRPTTTQLKIVVPIKGGRESVVRLSKRAWQAIRAYLRLRAPLDKDAGSPPEATPVFAQHGQIAEQSSPKKGRPFAKRLRRWQASGVQALFRLANAELFPEAPRQKGQRGWLTPHSLRHYFITRIWRKTHDLHLAQRLARHQSIHSTQRYTHIDDPALDKTYREVFDPPG